MQRFYWLFGTITWTPKRQSVYCRAITITLAERTSYFIRFSCLSLMKSFILFSEINSDKMKAIQARIWLINMNFATKLCEWSFYANAMNLRVRCTQTHNRRVKASTKLKTTPLLFSFAFRSILTVNFYSNLFAFNFVSTDEYKCFFSARQNKTLFPISLVSLFRKMRINFRATFFAK